MTVFLMLVKPGVFLRQELLQLLASMQILEQQEPRIQMEIRWEIPIPLITLELTLE